MGNKKRKSSNSKVEDLKWELRKRGVRPTGDLTTMMKRLDELKEKEKEELQQRMNNNKVKANSHPANDLKKLSKNENDMQRRIKRKTDQLRHDRSQIVLWKAPLLTLKYFLLEVPCSISDAKNRIIASLYDPRKKSIPLFRQLCILISVMFLFYGFYFYTFKDDEDSLVVKESISWHMYWVFLGILSSVGLGTGLHTFVLYLGPFIAKVTLAAHECGTVNFPRPPYPDQVICPSGDDHPGVSVWEIVAKIRWESLMWGFGTALGELPPYFMARAARISGMDADEELEEFTELLQRKKKIDPKSMSLIERAKVWMEDLVEKVGFWGILACASIPNPLFDLAGITCGHFLVPFATFFGATVIGKAIIKAHLQMIFVILAFNEDLLKMAVDLVGSIPTLGHYVSDPFTKFMHGQKANLHSKPGNGTSDGGVLAFLLEKLVMGMVIYFVISIINSMAQSHHKRIHKEHTKIKS